MCTGFRRHWVPPRSVGIVALSLSAALVLIGGIPILGQTKKNEKPRRARLPQRSALPKDIFFEDAFREALVGSRPSSLGPARSVPLSFAEAAAPGEAGKRGSEWSKIVSAETLEDEVKELQIALDSLITTPARFTAGGFREARRAFSELAMLLAVIGEYDRDVRWKDDAPLARDRFARAAAQAQVGSLEAYQEAKRRQLDLQTLVRGGTLGPSPSSTARVSWDRICDRSLLMERLSVGLELRLTNWAASPGDIRGHLEGMRREGELVRLIAEVLTREGMADADDEDYVANCRRLSEAAQSLLDVLEQEDYRALPRANSDLRRACDHCHDDYR